MGIDTRMCLFNTECSRASFESFLCSEDTHTQMYSLGPDNQRTIGSLTCETVFGDVTAMDPTGKGCPKSHDISRIVGNMAF